MPYWATPPAVKPGLARIHFQPKTSRHDSTQAWKMLIDRTPHDIARYIKPAMNVFPWKADIVRETLLS
jgi:hypothetical protein